MRKRHSIIGILVLVAAAGFLQSCNNPFGTGSSANRFTPRISRMTVQRASVFPGVPFNIQFLFSDPQNDIATVEVTMIGSSNSGLVQEVLSWSDTSQVTHTAESPGTATVTVSFPSSGSPEGNYTIRLTVTDEKDHVSNILEGDIDLL